MVQTVVATGRVVSVSRVQVGSEITGILLERRVQEGDHVQAGEVLAVLRADDLGAGVREAEAALAQLRKSVRPQALAAVRQADAQLEQASREAQRRRQLFQRRLIARETLEQAEQAETVARTTAERARLTAQSLAAGNPDEVLVVERLAAARAALAKTFIRAQVAGTVLTRNAEPGDLIQPGRVLFEIARQGDTELLVPLDEKNLGVLALGQQAQCIADAYPTRPFTARVSLIAPSVDPQRGSVDIRLKVDPVPDFLKQDMTVSVNIETGRRMRALVVPNDSLESNDGRAATVWLVRDGKARRARVRLGLQGLAATEITGGLKAGDWVLVAAPADLRDGTRVRMTRQAPLQSGGGPAVRELPIKLD
jgi:HlyD family secretion protein